MVTHPIVKESPGGRLVRRAGAAGVALATALALAGCHEARGGGYIGTPVDGSPVFNGEASFGFNFQCDGGVKGEITYHDKSTKGAFAGLRLHGTVENVLIEVVPDDPETPVDETVVEPAATCEELIEAPAAHFEGSYRSQEKKLQSKPRGRFHVLVFDQGEPSRSAGDFTGDGFSIELFGGAYPIYTRGGYIEGGNIQVKG